MQIPSAWQAAKEALRFARNNFGQLLRYSIAPTLASFAINQTLLRSIGGDSINWTILIPLLIGAICIHIQYSIRGYRLYAYDDTFDSIFSMTECFTTRFRRYMIYGFLLILTYGAIGGLLLALVLSLTAPLKIPAVTMVACLIPLIGFAYFFFGLSFVLPGAALDLPVSFKRSLGLTRGIKLKLLGSTLAAGWPLYVAGFVIGILRGILKIAKADPLGIAASVVELLYSAVFSLGVLVALLPIVVLFKALALPQNPEPAPAGA